MSTPTRGCSSPRRYQERKAFYPRLAKPAGGLSSVRVSDIFNYMVEDFQLDTVYGALADPSRRAILSRLADAGELRVTEVAEPFPLSLNAVSKHIKVLERSGLVRRRIDGRDHWLSLDPEPLAHAWAWLSIYQRFWESRLDTLDAFLQRRAAGSAPANEAADDQR